MRLRVTLSILFTIAVFMFWWLGYPHALSYQEQNQLFLFTVDYLVERVSIAGGLADYLGEFLTQFYIIPALGALFLSLVFLLLQCLTWAVMKRLTKDRPSTAVYLLSFVPSLLLLWHLGDENTLLSFPVAIILSLSAALLMQRRSAWFDLLTVPVLYWFAGPVAWLYVALRILFLGYKTCWLLLYMAATVLVANAFVLSQWPSSMVFLGLNYYRIPQKVPPLQVVLPLALYLIIYIATLAGRKLGGKVAAIGSACVVVLLAFLAISQGFDADKYELIRQDYLVRNEQWDTIIERADRHVVKTPFWSECVNLALAMKRQLAERQFSYYQSGEDALLMPVIRDNTSGWPTAEACWRLGMVNTAQRGFFEIQSAILNKRNSGRCMKRLAECAIVNGQYAVADKYLSVLRHSLFYRRWAERASKYLNDNAVRSHPVWGTKRKLRFQTDFLYSSRILDQMFAMLFLSNKDNKMALDYMMAQLLLYGKAESFARSMPMVEKQGGYSAMPAGYREAMKVMQGKAEAGNNYQRYINQMNNETK